MHLLMNDFAALEALGRNLFRQFIPTQDNSRHHLKKDEEFAIPVNIAEDENNYYIKAMVSGADPGKIDLSVIDDQLTISGKVENPFGEEKLARMHARELTTGLFRRTVKLPTTVELNKVKASCSNGVLTVELPKAEAAKPHRINVSMN